VIMNKLFSAALASATMLSVAALAAPANAQYYRDYDHYGRTLTRCDRDGDRCATYRCDRDGDDCRRISGWYARSYAYQRGYGYGRDQRERYYDRDDGNTVRRCDAVGDDCHYYRCDRDGDDCQPE
jgi:hypothetical protein